MAQKRICSLRKGACGLRKEQQAQSQINGREPQGGVLWARPRSWDPCREGRLDCRWPTPLSALSFSIPDRRSTQAGAWGAGWAWVNAEAFQRRPHLWWHSGWVVCWAELPAPTCSFLSAWARSFLHRGAPSARESPWPAQSAWWQL